MKSRLHVLAVRKGSEGLGGLSAQRNLSCSVEAFDCYARDPLYTRVQVVRVTGSVVEILRDQTFPERIDHREEERRVRRLDNRDDSTVRHVLRIGRDE